MAGDLTSTDYAFLIILRAEGRELSNTEMDELYQVRLKGPAFARLNGAGYVVSDTKHRPYRHAITKQGEKVLADPLTIEQDGEGSPLRERERQLWAALVALQNENLLLRAGRNGTTRVHEKPPADLRDRIRTEYTRLAGMPGKWVNLTDLRPLFADVSKADLDKALAEMLDADDVRLEPEPFGHRIGAAERDAAVHIGGEDRHKLAIGLR